MQQLFYHFMQKRKLRQEVGGGGDWGTFPGTPRWQNPNLNPRESSFRISQNINQCPAVSQYTYLHISEKYTALFTFKKRVRGFDMIQYILCCNLLFPNVNLSGLFFHINSYKSTSFFYNCYSVWFTIVYLTLLSCTCIFWLFPVFCHWQGCKEQPSELDVL